MLVMALHLIGLSVAFSSISATPLPVHTSVEGSAEEEELLQLSPSPSLPPTAGPASEQPTTPPGGPAPMDKVFLDRVVDFVEDNLLLICVGSTLLFLILLIICGSVFMSRRRKVNAYYPSSFPPQMYVDERDKAGGTKPFNEVPEKAASAEPSQRTDSGKQLQADIMRAAKKLRTPTKPAPAGERGSDQSPEAGRQEHAAAAPAAAPDSSDTSREGQEEPCRVSHGETAADGGTGDPEGPPTATPPPEPEPEPEPPAAGLEQDESDARSPSGTGPSQAQQDLGTSSQNHRRDSSAPPTPPLITGEKTAF